MCDLHNESLLLVDNDSLSGIVGEIFGPRRCFVQLLTAIRSRSYLISIVFKRRKILQYRNVLLETWIGRLEESTRLVFGRFELVDGNRGLLFGTGSACVVAACIENERVPNVPSANRGSLALGFGLASEFQSHHLEVRRCVDHVSKV